MSTASHASFSGCNIHTLSSIINHKSPEALELIIQKAHCRVRTDRGQAWYTVGKIMAERKAWEIAERTGLDVISILPAMCYGPNLQKEVSPSNITMLPLFHGSYIPLMFCYGGPVDVRDVAAAMILLYETPSASGRYICAESYAPISDVMNLVAQLYPRHNIPQIENTQPWLARCKSPSKRLEALGFKFRPSSEGIIAALQEFEERGLIPKLDS